MEKNIKLYREFKFRDFSEAFAFMTRVAFLAESQKHHPVWKNSYNIVEIWLSTHDEGDKIGTKDKTLAESIDKIIAFED